jgi:phosphoesterase RecJ-like protein
MSEALNRAAEALEAGEDVALACHINPDPDALGSMLGLSVFLRARRKKTVCSYGNQPFEHPRWVDALPGADALVEPRKFPRAPMLMVTLDCASKDRLGLLAANADRAQTLVWIDHHVSNEGLGTIPVIEPKASSTAEIVLRLMHRMGGDVPPDAAACLYAGIVTDTGRFQYESTSPETLRLASELRKLPFDHARLAQAMFEDNSIAYLRVLATALSRLEHVPDADLVWTYVKQADVAKENITLADTDDLIDVIRTAREADVACVIKEQRDGRLKVSVRSRGDMDVAAIAAGHGGGGHRLAAGYTSKSGLEETIRALIEDLRKAKIARAAS